MVAGERSAEACGSLATAWGERASVAVGGGRWRGAAGGRWRSLTVGGGRRRGAAGGRWRSLTGGC